jgi:hypothetical protein
MTWFSDLRKRWGMGRPEPPVITTMIDGVEHTVTESQRKQAAINMRLDPAKRAAVERLLQDRYGEARGLAEALRRYPEAYL